MSDSVNDLKNFVKKYNNLKSEISKVIVGQNNVIDKVLISIFVKDIVF